MATYYPKDLSDVAVGYHRLFITGKKIVDLSADFRNYSVHEDFQNPTYYDGGEKTFNYMLQVGSYSNYQRDALNNPESYTTGNLLIQASAYWAYMKDGWAIDDREPGFKRSASSSEIVSLFDTKRRNLWNSIYKNEELNKWTLAAYPNDGTSGFIRCKGIPNYLVKASSSTVAAVTSHPSGYSSVDGVSRSTYPQTANYGATYTDMIDLDTKMSTAFYKMSWTPPMQVGQTANGTGNYVIETTFDTRQKYRQMLRASNSNIGTDFGKYYGAVDGMGNVVYMGVPMVAISALSDSTLRDGTTNDAYDSTNPVYMRDKSTWQLIAAKGDFLREDPPHRKDNPKRVVSFDVFSTHSRVCVDPSKNCVLHVG